MKYSDVISNAICISDLGQGPAGSWKVIFGTRALAEGRCGLSPLDGCSLLPKAAVVSLRTGRLLLLLMKAT